MTARPALSQEIEALIGQVIAEEAPSHADCGFACSLRSQLVNLALAVASSVRKADAGIARTLAFKCDREANATMAASEGTAEGAAMELAAMAVAANRIAAAIEEASK